MVPSAHHILSTTRETNRSSKRTRRREGKNERFLQIENLNVCGLREGKKTRGRKCSTREKSKTTVMSDREGCARALAQNHGQ